MTADVAVRPVNTLALCAGVGMLELGVDLALGGTTRPVAYVERDPFAAAVLVARMEDKSLGEAPVWDDVTTFDGTPFRGCVDLVCAGFSCQPWSSAGQRKGTDDERWIWPDIVRVLREVEPGLVFLENVPPLVARGGLAIVLGSLADLGFDAEWGMLSALQLGGTHQRKRVFILAYRDDCRLSIERSVELPDERDTPCRDDSDGPCGEAVADAELCRCHGRAPEPKRRTEQRTAAQGPGEGLADTRGVQPERRRGTGDVAGTSGVVEGEARQRERRVDASEHRCEDVADSTSTGEREPLDEASTEPRARARALASGSSSDLADTDERGVEQGQRDLLAWESDAHEIGPFPPGPDDADEWRRTHGPQPSVRRVADGLAYRMDRLHAIGNGVVPLVAAHAFTMLGRRAGILEVVDV